MACAMTALYIPAVGVKDEPVVITGAIAQSARIVKGRFPLTVLDAQQPHCERRMIDRRWP